MNSYWKCAYEQYLQERAAKEAAAKETDRKNLEYIFNGISKDVQALGLTIELTNKNRFGEDKEHRIVITHPELSDFRADILGREGSDSDRASLHFNLSRSVSYLYGQYSDGSDWYQTKEVRFDSLFSDPELMDMGLEKRGYDVPLHQLNIGFKATKNIKLIIRDVMPKLKIYLTLVTAAKSRLDARFDKDAHTLELQNKVSQFTQYKHVFQELKDRSFTLSIGEVTIDSYGAIELRQTLTEEQLLSILENCNKPN